MNLSGRWFALVVKSQHEFKVAKCLADKGFEPFLPTYKERRAWSDRTKLIELPLFGGYVFARFEYPAFRISVLRTPGVRSLVSFGDEAASITEWEIENLRKLLASGFPLQPWPFLQPGQRVLIEQGPLRGAEGVIMGQKDTWRMIVNVEILQRAVAVILDRESLSHIRPSVFSRAALTTVAEPA